MGCRLNRHKRLIRRELIRRELIRRELISWELNGRRYNCFHEKITILDYQ